jgi:hypothetical protein
VVRKAWCCLCFAERKVGIKRVVCASPPTTLDNTANKQTFRLQKTPHACYVFRLALEGIRLAVSNVNAMPDLWVCLRLVRGVLCTSQPETSRHLQSGLINVHKGGKGTHVAPDKLLRFHSVPNPH